MTTETFKKSSRGRTPTGQPNPIDVHVGNRIRLRRTLLGLSQEKLASLLGLTFQQVQKYERGMNRVGASRQWDIGKVLEVPVGFFYEDMDIFVEDTTKNQQQIEALKNLMQPAMQNGASLLDIAEIITMDNVTMIRSKLEEIEQKRMEQQQAMEQAQAEREQQMAQIQNEIKEEALMLKEAEMDLKKYEIDSNNATKITVAQLNAYRGAENMDQDGSGVPDVIEIGKQAIEQQKVNSDIASKQFEFNNKKREMEMKREIENKKIELEKQKMKQEMELQKQKDKAAMEREQLKARTAKQNKVVGEK